MSPPVVRIIDKNGLKVDGQTLPTTGRKIPDESLPVVLAAGVNLTQTYVSVPQTDKTSSDTFTASVKLVIAANPLRRYLKIINNGQYDVELWSATPPSVNTVGSSIPQGEVIARQGGGIGETDTCRTSAIWATCAGGVTGLCVLEG